MKPYLTLHHPAAARRYYERGYWSDQSCYDLLLAHASARPQALALRDGKRQLTWTQVLAWVDGMAAQFDTLGLTPGERVSVWMSNTVHPIITFLACSRAGLACNPSLHRTFTCNEIITLLTRLKAGVLVTEPGWGADRDKLDLRALVSELDFVKAVYEPDDFPGPLPAGSGLGPPQGDPDSVAYLAFTSGTTGAPKCVMHSCNTLLANARDMVNDWRLTSDKRLLSLSPLSHHIAWVGVAQWLIAGCEFITDDPPAGTHRLDWMLQTRASYVLGVPTHAMDILTEHRARSMQGLGDVETFYMAGAAIPPAVAQAIVDNGVKPQNVYGMTENSSHQYTHPDDDLPTWTTTCGRGGPAYEVRIFETDSPDKEVATGQTGQICGRGAALMLGYFDNQQATEDSFNAAGWFMSGDLGSFDDAGNLRIDGRIKDLIIRGGHNIYPVHIEALAHRHQKIQKAAAFPIADDRLGEKVCLAIIGSISAAQALEHLAAQGLSKYDMPEYFVNLTEMPLTPSGKILKRELIEMVRRGDLAPQPVRAGNNSDSIKGS
ncbi:MAG: class I adenylate-forming enzyme family protein [Burkholderiaceae bacterium]